MTPIEKAARAAFGADENRAGEFDHRSKWVQDNYREIAIAVLRAIREPSAGMVEARYVYGIDPSDAEAIYQAMIDKALEEG